MIDRGIGCIECGYRGVMEYGTGRVWVSGGEVYEDLHERPCPNCTPPDVPERNFTEDEEDAALAEAEAIW